MADTRGHVFLSAPFLSKQYSNIPADVLDNSIFWFNAKRAWLFPSTREEMLEARSQPAKYLEFDEDFISLILRKDKGGLVFWLLPEKSFAKALEFVEGSTDLASQEKYLPLILDTSWWNTEFQTGESKYCNDVEVITYELKVGAFNPDAVMEIMYQSNPTLVPTLHWSQS